MSPDTLRKYLGSNVEGTGKFHGVIYQCPCNINVIKVVTFVSFAVTSLFLGDSAVQLFI